jgi:hypothetical protein
MASTVDVLDGYSLNASTDVPVRGSPKSSHLVGMSNIHPSGDALTSYISTELLKGERMEKCRFQK